MPVTYYRWESEPAKPKILHPESKVPDPDNDGSPLTSEVINCWTLSRGLRVYALVDETKDIETTHANLSQTLQVAVLQDARTKARRRRDLGLRRNTNDPAYSLTPEEIAVITHQTELKNEWTRRTTPTQYY